jgi:large subunit ribosomal protein L24
MISAKPRKQRKKMFNAPLHKKRKFIGAHLEENLLLKYDKRALPVVKGDTVRVMRGSFRGHEDKIVRVDVKKRCLEIEGITMSKADGNKIAKPVHSSNVVITKLNLTDKWRRKKLERNLSDETKKEIEEEAEEQIKIAEEERKKEEQEKARLEEEAAKEDKEEIIDQEKPPKKKDEEKPKEKQTKKPAPKKGEEKQKPKKKAAPVKKKSTATKPKSTKKPEKKTPSKTTKKKEEKK